MIGAEHLPESTVDIAREIHDAASSNLLQVHAGQPGTRARVDRFHGQVRIRRHNAQRRELIFVGGGYIHLVDGIDNATGVFESAEQRMVGIG